MKRVIAVLVVLLMVGGLVSCTAQQRAKKFGGSTSIDLPVGKKLVIATWKEDNLWLLYRNRQAGEKVESYVFQESSSWGVLEGNIIIKEQ